MKVSIITVTYNAERYLEDCIRSVQGQLHKNIEHIIVDGSSTDGTVDIIRRNERGISKWVSEKDGGMYDALNKGLKMATGDIVGVLNSDDILENCMVISQVVSTFSKTNTDAVYGDLEFVHPDDTNKVIRVWKGREYKRSLFEFGWMPAHPTFYIRRSCIEQCGDYKTIFFTAADYEFMLRCLYKNRLCATYIPSLFVKMRTGGQSDFSLKHRLRANRRDYLAMKWNGVPYALFASILKPLIKLKQFRSGYLVSNQASENSAYVIETTRRLEKLDKMERVRV